MEKNIFEGAKFGDKFVTNKGSIALFDHRCDEHSVILLVESTVEGLTCGEWLMVSNSGKYGKFGGTIKENVVSRYQEPIDELDEHKLDELAKDNIPTFYEEDDEWIIPFEYGFKKGYRKAIEE